MKNSAEILENKVTSVTLWWYTGWWKDKYRMHEPYGKNRKK